MSARIAGLFLLPAAVLAFSTPLLAQSQPADAGAAKAPAEADTVARLTQRVAELEQKMLTKDDLEAFKAELIKAVGAQKQPPQPTEEPAGAAEAPTAAKRNMGPIPAARAEDAAPPAAGMSPQPASNAAGPVTRTEFDSLKSLVLDNDAILGQIAKNVGGQGAESLYVPNVLGNMDKSPQFRGEMKEAVRNSMDQQGTMLVRNRTAGDKWIRIRGNGVDKTVYVAGGAVVRESVPVGTLTTELLGYEGPRNWTIAPPNNAQTIDILPAPAVVPSPPVYYEPVVWWY